jgi:hypothetical protein
MKRNFFDISRWVFWILVAIMGVLILPYFKNGLYDENKINEWVKNFDTIQPVPLDDTLIEIDTTGPINDTLSYAFKVWDWHDFDDKWHAIRFKYLIGSLEKSTKNRINNMDYGPLYSHDKLLLKDLIRQMKEEINESNLDYMQALEYVCSSIQDIPYTLVVPESDGCPCEKEFGSFSAYCRVQSDGNGCCEGVEPFGVYAPFEFTYKETGDCDTRALLAFTLLKEMGFDVAVMVSRNEHHSVLGVSKIGGPNNSYGRNAFGKKYYLWELTNPDWRFGMNVSGNDWYADLE